MSLNSDLREFLALLKAINDNMEEVIARLDTLVDLVECQQDPPTTFIVEGWENNEIE